MREGKIIKQRLSKIELWEGRMLGKTTAADSEPAEKRERTQQAGVPTLPWQRTRAEQGGGGKRKAGFFFKGVTPLPGA